MERNLFGGMVSMTENQKKKVTNKSVLHKLGIIFPYYKYFEKLKYIKNNYYPFFIKVF